MYCMHCIYLLHDCTVCGLIIYFQINILQYLQQMDQQNIEQKHIAADQDSSGNQMQQQQPTQKVYQMSLQEVQNSNANAMNVISANINKPKKQIRCGIRQGCQDINNFRRLNKIHQGVYGIVFRAEDQITKQIVAIKKLKLIQGTDFPITSLRQIAILKAVNHQNIIKIKKVSGNAKRNRVFIVMEYMDHQIKRLLTKEKIVFTEEQIRRLMKDLLLGIDCLHQKNIVHRDLKTSNLLYSNDGTLKICDFGLARRIAPTSMMTQQVISLRYRPPQLLLGPTIYSTEVDIWSIGCIFGELVLGDALFQGKTQIDQLDAIFKIMGSPTNQTWPNFKQNKNAMYVIGGKYPENKLRSIISKQRLSDSGIDLLNKLLVPYPKKRINAEKALRHEWFKGPMTQRDRMPTCNPINELDVVQKRVKT